MPPEVIEYILRLAGGRQFRAETEASARSLHQLDRAHQGVSSGMRESTRRSFLWNQAMFTTRRVIYGLTLATGGLATAAGVMGFRFNMAMESNQIAFDFLLGSVEEAQREISFLYDLAAKTPFEFVDVSTAARRLLAFGFNLQETNRMIGATADAVATLGDKTLIDRVIRAFGQIHAKGRVMGEELLQLTEAQIPALRYLQEELGLTGDQMAQIGLLRIPADVAIEAILRGIERDFAGASERFAQTTEGRLTTLLDYTRQLMGQIVMAPFEAVSGALPGAINLVQIMATTMRERGFHAMIVELDAAVDASGNLVLAFDWVERAGRDLISILTDGIVPAFRDVWSVAKFIVIPALWSLGWGLHFIGVQAEALRPLIFLLVTWWVVARVHAMALAFWTSIMTGEFILLRIWIRYTWMEQRIATLWMARHRAAIWLGVWANRAFTASLALATTGLRLFGMAIVTTTILLATSPIGLIIVGVLALAAGLVILYLKWDAFHDRVNALFGFFRDNWQILLLPFSPLMTALSFLGSRWDWMRNKVSQVWDWVASFWNWLNEHVFHIKIEIKRPKLDLFGDESLWGKLGLPNWDVVPKGQMGFHALAGGVALIGEGGPELMNIPPRATVAPLPAGFDVREWMDSRPQQIHLQNDIFLDGRKIAEVVADHTLEREARD